MTGVGSLSCLFFTDEEVVDYRSAKTSDVSAFADYFRYMLAHGIYVAPSQFEAIFLSSVHTKEDVDRTLTVIEDYWKEKANR